MVKEESFAKIAWDGQTEEKLPRLWKELGPNS